MRTVLDGAPDFVDDAVEHLAACLGDSHRLVLTGRRVTASLTAIPAGSMLVTEESLAEAIRRAWPYRQKTPSGLALSAASIMAALRTPGPALVSDPAPANDPRR
jgi:hypothetical protein